MKQCFGYVRVSTTKQGEGVSLIAQREAIEQFAARNDITITRWFEETETAAKTGRPEFTAMLRLLKQRKAAGVVMHKIDRSARNFADWAKIGDLSDAGIDVHFATESLDFRSRGGRLAADIQAVIAADYIRNLREEIKKGIYGRLNQGIYPFQAPIGYLDQGGGQPKVFDPTRAPLVRQAFELYATGNYSLMSLLPELDRLGLRNHSGRPLAKCGLETILDNPFYCGLIRLKKTGAVYQGAHEPLISVSLFERVQAIKAGKAVKKATRRCYTYRGLFRCNNCGFLLTPELQKGHVYYRCHGRECPITCVREEAIQKAIETTLARTKLAAADAESFVCRFEAWWKESRHGDKAANATMQLGRVEARLERLTEAMLDRLIDEKTFSAQKEKLLLEKLEIEGAIKNALAQCDEPARLQKFFELVNRLLSSYISANPGEKRELVQIATSNRVVSGKNVFVEPANWLLHTQNAIAVCSGGAERPSLRRPSNLSDDQVERFMRVIHSETYEAAVTRIAHLTGAPPSTSGKRKLPL